MKRIKVFLCLEEGSEIPVGELAEKEHRIYFQYDANFLSKSIWLSPYKLPLSPDLYEHRDTDFGPIFGLFDDSLPDGWGLLLMDKFLKSHGFLIEELSILDRLSFLGANTMGAITYKPLLGVEPIGTVSFDLNDLYIQSQKIIEGKVQTVLPELMKAGGSPGGAHPKVLVGVSGDRLISGEGSLPGGFEHWIIKFNGINDFVDSGSVEYAYSLMAKDCGITCRKHVCLILIRVISFLVLNVLTEKVIKGFIFILLLTLYIQIFEYPQLIMKCFFG